MSMSTGVLVATVIFMVLALALEIIGMMGMWYSTKCFWSGKAGVDPKRQPAEPFDCRNLTRGRRRI